MSRRSASMPAASYQLRFLLIFACSASFLAGYKYRELNIASYGRNSNAFIQVPPRLEVASGPAASQLPSSTSTSSSLVTSPSSPSPTPSGTHSGTSSVTPSGTVSPSLSPSVSLPPKPAINFASVLVPVPEFATRSVVPVAEELGKHAVLMVGLTRALYRCVPDLLRVMNGTSSTVDFYAVLGRSTDPDIDEKGLRALAEQVPRLRAVAMYDLNAPVLPSEVMSFVPSFPYPMVQGPDNPPLNVVRGSFAFKLGWEVMDHTLREHTRVTGKPQLHRYDRIVRIRPDLWFHESTLPLDLDNVTRASEILEHWVGRPGCPVFKTWLSTARSDNSTCVEHDLYTATHSHWSGLNDNFAFGSHSAMHLYFNHIDHIEQVCATEGVRFHPETLVKAGILAGLRKLTQADGLHRCQVVNVHKVPVFRYFLCRDDNCPQSWQPPLDLEMGADIYNRYALNLPPQQC